MTAKWLQEAKLTGRFSFSTNTFFLIRIQYNTNKKYYSLFTHKKKVPFFVYKNKLMERFQKKNKTQTSKRLKGQVFFL